MSGGRATVAFRKHGTRHRNQVGDISYVNDIGKKFIDQFVVECKFYADLNYLGLLTGKGKLLDFWAKLKKEAKDHDKHPFLVARQNRLQAHVIVDIDGRRELGFSNSRQTLLISIPHNLYIYDADNFFKACPPYL